MSNVSNTSDTLYIELNEDVVYELVIPNIQLLR